MAFQRSSSFNLLFQAFILVFGTPSEILQSQTLSEYNFIRSPFRKSRAPAFTGLPSLPWQEEQFTSIFLTPSKISLPSAMIFGSVHQPAGICLSANSGGAGGGGAVLSFSSAHPTRNPAPLINTIPRTYRMFIAVFRSFRLMICVLKIVPCA